MKLTKAFTLLAAQLHVLLTRSIDVHEETAQNRSIRYLKGVKPNKLNRNKPSIEPSNKPSIEPSNKPSTKPSNKPSNKPSRKPRTQRPTNKPSRNPTNKPSNKPSRKPTNANDLVTKPYFNLRLFWRKDYRWQETSRETFWCMTCTSSSCSPGSKVEVKWCNRSDSRQQWYFDNDKIRSRKNKQLCLQRYGRSIKLNECSSNKDQKWGGLRKDMPFELQIPGNTEKCASQHHHPKDREEIYMESCKLAEKADTEKWVVF